MNNEEKILSILVALQSDISELKSDVSKLNENQIRMEKKLASIEGKVDTIETRLGSVEDKITSMEVRLDAVDNGLNTVDGRLSAIEKQTVILSEFRTEVMQKFHDLNESTTSIKEVLVDHELQIRSLKRRIPRVSEATAKYPENPEK